MLLVKRSFLFFFTAILLSILASCIFPFSPPLVHSIPIIGLDDNGEERNFFLTESQYQKKFIGEMSNVHTSTLKSLSRLDERDPAKFRVRQVVIGLGIALNSAFGPFEILSVEPSFSLVFQDLRIYEN